jgi:hypothetical protein
MKYSHTKFITSGLFLSSIIISAAPARAEVIGPCINHTRSAYSGQTLRAFNYQKVDGFLQYRSLREGWVQKHIPSSAQEEAYIESLEEGARYICRNEYATGMRCVPQEDACQFNKNAPDIWAQVEGPIQDAGSYWIKEDQNTSCILNKRLDGTIDTSVADCLRPRQDALDGISFSFFNDENRAHPSLGKIWFTCSYGFCGPDYKQIYVP